MSVGKKRGWLAKFRNQLLGEVKMSDEKCAQVVVYATSWCPDCIRARMLLKRLKVSYTEIDIDKDQAGCQVVLDHNRGQRIVPTIFFPDGSVLVEPSDQAMLEKLEALGIGLEE